MQLLFNPQLHMRCRCAGAGVKEAGTGPGLCELACAAQAGIFAREGD